MNMRKVVMDTYNQIIEDEEILRLLHYRSEQFNDSPLDESKPNILDMDNVDKFDIIDRHIIRSDQTDRLENESIITRLCVYPGRRLPTNGNYLLANQDIVFDIYVQNQQDHIDLRLSWIADRINELFINKKITGVNKIQFIDALPLNSKPDGYVGMKIIYRAVSKK